MKRYLPALVIAILLAGAFGAHAGYRIKLKSGSEFVTSDYWEEGTVVKFYSRGGILGVKKDQIANILEVEGTGDAFVETESKDIPPTAESALSPEGNGTLRKTDRENQQADPSSLPGAGPADHPVAAARAGEQNRDDHLKIYRDQKAELKAKFDVLWRQYLEASKNKDPEAKQAAMKQMTEFSAKIYELADEVKKKNNGILPDWWEGI